LNFVDAAVIFRYARQYVGQILGESIVMVYGSIVFYLLFGMSPISAGLPAMPDGFSSCPDSPNCVSSLSKDKAHFVEPLRYQGSRAEARQKLIDIVKNMQRTRLVKIEKDHIQVEFRSLIFRFVDDVEFFLPADESIIHVRSASRSGYYDLGANRRRVERLRAAF
jgi:uncharacterized protein (DUF1499 family)